MLINVLPDENVLLRDASEVSIIELEKLQSNLMYGIRLKNSGTQINILHLFILSPIQIVKNGKTI